MLYTNYQALKKLNKNLNGLKFLLQDYSIETMPQWINFQNTYSCNLRCPHCQTHGIEERRKIYNDKMLNMKEELLTKLAREVLPFASEYMFTVSGEPLMIKGIEDTIHELEQYGAKLHIITNGTLLNKKILAVLLPYTGRYYISMDGATKPTFEALRLGASFKHVLKNVKQLKRSLELLALEKENLIFLAFTIMGSNVHEMPEMVKLAAFLGVTGINGSFIVVMYDHVADEAIEFHKARYNFYRAQAQQLAVELGIAFDFPPPFPEVSLDPTRDHTFDRMIIKNAFPDSQETPPWESYLDLAQIEEDARRLAATVRTRSEKQTPIEFDETNKDLFEKMKNTYQQILLHHKKRLQQLSKNLDQAVTFCNYLFRTTYVAADGVVTPCCIVGRPILGNVSQKSMFEVWNGEEFNTFRRSFFSQNPEPCCQTCQYNVAIPMRSILHQFELPFSFE